MEPGDIHLADLNEEQRRSVMVVSVGRFGRLADRVVVVPALPLDDDAPPFPWRVRCDDAVFAVDFLRALPRSWLLQRTGRATPDALAQVRRALRHILDIG